LDGRNWKLLKPKRNVERPIVASAAEAWGQVDVQCRCVPRSQVRGRSFNKCGVLKGDTNTDYIGNYYIF
jgi:hypothetical protein